MHFNFLNFRELAHARTHALTYSAAAEDDLTRCCSAPADQGGAGQAEVCLLGDVTHRCLAVSDFVLCVKSLGGGSQHGRRRRVGETSIFLCSVCRLLTLTPLNQRHFRQVSVNLRPSTPASCRPVGGRSPAERKVSLHKREKMANAVIFGIFLLLVSAPRFPVLSLFEKCRELSRCCNSFSELN